MLHSVTMMSAHHHDRLLVCVCVLCSCCAVLQEMKASDTKWSTPTARRSSVTLNAGRRHADICKDL